MDFLKLIESYDKERASTGDVLRGDGVSLRKQRLVRLGERMVPRDSDDFLDALTRVEVLLGEAASGDWYARGLFKEAMTTSDFPTLLGDILDKRMLDAYRTAPSTWPAVALEHQTADFRDMKRYPSPTGAESILESVAERAAYPHRKIDEGTPVTYAVEKYGAMMSVSMEMDANDNFGIFRTLPTRLGTAARVTEQYKITNLYVGASGPSASVYTVGHSNVITGNPAFSAANLAAALSQLDDAVTADGNPRIIEIATLEVPPALSMTVDEVLAATELRFVDTTGHEYLTKNFLAGRVRKVVNPWLQTIPTSNGKTAWYLHANPTTGAAAFEASFLSGYRDPGIFMRAPNAQRVGGGLEVWSFDSDDLDYKVRHILGCAVLDTSLTYASNGSGS